MICLIFRKKNPLFFSLEKVFSAVMEAMSPDINITKVEVPHYSTSPAAIAANIRAVKRVRAAVYHITGDVHYVVLGLPRKKTVLTIHDCVFLQQAEGIKKRILKAVWLTWPVRAAAIVTTISEASKAEIIRHTGVRPDKILVIPNPIGGYIYHREKVFDPARPVILFLGSTPNKNLNRVIEAVQDLGCLLDIVGKISPEQEARMKTLGIAYRTSQQLTEEELAERYAGSDLVLFPSTYEGFGLPIAEAQKAGRPVITSDLSPMKEVAGAGACLVDPYSVESIRTGLLRMIRDKPYREKLVEEGLRNVARFDSARIAGQYEDCYKKLIDKACAE